MKSIGTVALLLASSAAALAQTNPPPAKSLPDSSASTQCWDVLQNVARDKFSNEGKLQATGDYARQHSSSSEDKKVQGPGAEPKDPTGVTVGESNQGKALTGSSIRPAGLPNC
jgi:hypothetical protein